MNNIKIALFTTLIISNAEANYAVKVPLEHDKGGHLLNGSILLSTNESWVDHDPIYGEWENVGEPYNCSNITPESSTVYIGTTFQQTSSDCDQNQTRLVQKRIIDENSGKIKNTDDVLSENQIVKVDVINDVIGTGTSWEIFATTKELPITNSWNNLTWNNKSLKDIPIEPYPLNEPLNTITLANNQIKSIQGLSNIKKAGSINLYGNAISDISPLSNLESIGTLDIRNTFITDISSLLNLKLANTLYLNTAQNRAININGLQNVLVNNTIWIYKNQAITKLNANSLFCLNNDESKFGGKQNSSLMVKSDVCETN